MQRYFVLRNDNWSENQVMITGEDVHHISRVMRNKIGDKIICNHFDGRAAVCTILELQPKKVIVAIDEWLEQEAELLIDVTIVQALPKGDKLDFIMQKGTELGAAVFVPFKSERSIAHWDAKKTLKKLERYKRIVKESSEQSHRNRIPQIEAPVNLQELIDYSVDYDFKIFAYEEEAKTAAYRSFASILKQVKEGMRLLICIGPEGGFSKNEAITLKDNDFHAVRFGPRILRTETAALYALSSISYHFEELGWNQ